MKKIVVALLILMLILTSCGTESASEPKAEIDNKTNSEQANEATTNENGSTEVSDTNTEALNLESDQAATDKTNIPEFVGGHKVLSSEKTDTSFGIEMDGIYEAIEGVLFMDEMNDGYGFAMDSKYYDTLESFEISFPDGDSFETFSVTPPGGLFSIDKSKIIGVMGQDAITKLDNREQIKVTCNISHYGNAIYYRSEGWASGDLEIISFDKKDFQSSTDAFQIPEYIGSHKILKYEEEANGFSVKMDGIYKNINGHLGISELDPGYFFYSDTPVTDAIEIPFGEGDDREVYTIAPPSGAIEVDKAYIVELMGQDAITRLDNGEKINVTCDISNYVALIFPRSEGMTAGDVKFVDFEKSNTANNAGPAYIGDFKVKSYSNTGDSMKVALDGQYKGLEGTLVNDYVFTGAIVFMPSSHYEGAYGSYSDKVGGTDIVISPPMGMYALNETYARQVLGETLYNKLKNEQGLEIKATCNLSNYSVLTDGNKFNYEGDIDLVNFEKIENPESNTQVTPTTVEDNSKMDATSNFKVTVSKEIAFDKVDYELGLEDMTFFSDALYEVVGNGLKLMPSDYNADNACAPMGLFRYGEYFGKGGYRSMLSGFDYKFDVDVTFNDDTNGNVGIAFGASGVKDGVDDFDGFYVGISPGKDQLIIRRAAKGTWEKLETRDLIKKVSAGDTVHLTIKTHQVNAQAQVMDGSTIKVLVDGQPNGTTSYMDPHYGYFGMRTWQSSATFSNLKVTR